MIKYTSFQFNSCSKKRRWWNSNWTIGFGWFWYLFISFKESGKRRFIFNYWKYFYAIGIEGDQYTVIGEIIDVDLFKNSFSNESLGYDLSVNGMDFDICINPKHLLGEPKIGRRIKSVIWLQGTVNFPGFIDRILSP